MWRRGAELGYPNAVLRKAGILLVTAALGFGAAIGAAACGDDDRGSVDVEGGTGTAPTTPTETESTETSP
jgi:hypothetical protein